MSPLNTVALELVPSNVERGLPHAAEEARQVVRLCAAAGILDRIGHVMIPGMIEEDEGRPVERSPRSSTSRPCTSALSVCHGP